MATLPHTLGSEGMQVQKGAHKGRNIAVLTSGGDSQGNVIFCSRESKFYIKLMLQYNSFTIVHIFLIFSLAG